MTSPVDNLEKKTVHKVSEEINTMEECEKVFEVEEEQVTTTTTRKNTIITTQETVTKKTTEEKEQAD